MEQRNLGTSVPSTFTPNANNYTVLKNGFNKTPINFHNNFSNLHSTNDMLLMSLQQQLNELSNTNVPSNVDIHNSSKLITRNDLHSSSQYTTKASWNEVPKDKWNVQKNLECHKQHISYNNTFNSNLSSPNLLVNAKINDNRSPIETPPFSMTPHNIVQNGNTTFQNSPNINSIYNVRQQQIKRNNINSNIWSPYNNLNNKTSMTKSSNNIINEISNQSINSPTNNISHDISSIHNQKSLNQIKKFNSNNSNDFTQHCYNMNQIQRNNDETSIDNNTSPLSGTSLWRNIEENNFTGYSLKSLQSTNIDNNMFQKISDTINGNKINFENSISSQYNSQKNLFNNNTNDINNTITNFPSTLNNIKKSNNIMENLGEQQEQLPILNDKNFDQINDLADVDKEFEQILSSVARKESTSANNNTKEYNIFSNISSNVPKNNESNNSNNSLNINNDSKVPIVDLNFLAPLPLNNTIVLTEFPSSSSSKSSGSKFGLSGTINFTPPGSPTITDKNDSFNSFFVPFNSSNENNYLNTNNINFTSPIILQENLNKSTEEISTTSTTSTIPSNNNKNKIKNKDIINKSTLKKAYNYKTKKSKDLDIEDIKLLEKEQKEKEQKEFLDSLLFMPNKNNRNNCNVVPIYKQKVKPCYAEASSLMKEGLCKGKNAVDEYDFVDDEPEDILPKTVMSCDDESEDDTNNLPSKNKHHVDEKNYNSNENEININTNQKSRKYNEKTININKNKISQSNGISLLKILKERKINDHQKILINNGFIQHEICFKEHDIKFDINKNNEIKNELNNENMTTLNNNEIEVIGIGNNNDKKNNIIEGKNICVPPLKVLSMLAVDKKSPSIDENIMPAIPKLRIKIFKQEKIICNDNEINNSSNKKKKKRKIKKDEDYIYDTKNSKKKKRKKINDDDGYSNESTNYKAQIIMFEEHGYIEYGKKNSLTVDEWNTRDKTNYTRFNDKKIDKNTNILMKIKHIAPSAYINERLKMFEEASEGIGKGTFLIHKSDLSKDDIPLWKVDSQNLLQKFPALKDNNKNRTYMYKSSSTYSGWCDQLINEYMIINVNIVKQSRSECIVELPLPINDLFPVMSTIDIKDINIFKDGKISKELSSINEENKLILSKDDKVVENMLIYIEALLNHAISNTFLDKVKQGNDWNFLLAINEIDRINNEAKERVKQRVKWTEKVEITINEFLYCSIIDDKLLNYNKKDGKNHYNNVNIQCQACGLRSSDKIIQFFEKCIYNKETLEIDINTNEKNDIEELSAIDFHICEMCADLGEIYHRLTHMRFLTFMVCEQKLEELCMLDENVLPSKAISICLKDFKWLNAIMSDYYEIWKRIQRNDI